MKIGPFSIIFFVKIIFEIIGKKIVVKTNNKQLSLSDPITSTELSSFS